MSETCRHCGRRLIYSETREWLDHHDRIQVGAWVHADSEKLADCPRKCHPGTGSGTVATPMPGLAGRALGKILDAHPDEEQT